MVSGLCLEGAYKVFGWCLGQIGGVKICWGPFLAATAAQEVHSFVRLSVRPHSLFCQLSDA